jgi:hypothetical protein
MFDWLGLVGMFNGYGFNAVPNVHAGAYLHPTTAYAYSSSSPNIYSQTPADADRNSR